MTIYARDANAFDAEQVGLLEALGADLSYALDAIEQETEPQTRRGRRQKFVSLADQSTEFIGMCDMEYRPFYVDNAGRRLVGLDSLEQACRVPVPEFFPGRSTFYHQEFFPRVLREGRAEVEIRFRHFRRARHYG